MYKIFLHPKAKKELNKLDTTTQERVKGKIGELKEFPNRGKHLQHSTFWSLRIREYRTIYEINKTEKRIVVLFVGHRKHVYEDFSKLF